MGREIKRVPVNFDHPIGDVWPGYLFPDELTLPPCPDCNGEGWSPVARQLSETFYPHQAGSDVAAWCDKLTQDDVDHLVAEGRLRGREGVTAAEVNAANGPGRRHDWSLNHDAINRWLLIKRRAVALGADPKCSRCDGDGNIGTPEQRAAADNWERTEPPTGDGYQLWETVSEGSPVSPAFDSAEGLARWMSENRCTVNGPVPFDAALAWINGPGWAPSMMAVGGRIVDPITEIGR